MIIHRRVNITVKKPKRYRFNVFFYYYYATYLFCADIFNVFSGGYPCGRLDVTHTQSERYFLCTKTRRW